MNAKTVIPLVLGVGVGGMAIKLVVDVVNQAKGATQASMTSCVVAKMDIDFADEITAQKLQLRDWPRESLPTQYFSDLGELKGRVSSMYIPKDVPIYPSMLAPAGTPPGIQTRIKPGFRAVSVGIDEITGVAYQLKPGDRVDVVSLVKREMPDGRPEDVSRIILQNVEIAAVGRTLHSGQSGESPKSVARSVTLLLKPEQITQLHLAQTSRGKISLALRGASDAEGNTEIAGATNDLLLGTDLPEEPEPEPQPIVMAPIPAPEPVQLAAPISASWIVKVVRGNEMHLVEYRNLAGRWVPADEAPPENEPLAMPTPATVDDLGGHNDFQLIPDRDYGGDT